MQDRFSGLYVNINDAEAPERVRSGIENFGAVVVRGAFEPSALRLRNEQALGLYNDITRSNDLETLAAEHETPVGIVESTRQYGDINGAFFSRYTMGDVRALPKSVASEISRGPLYGVLAETLGEKMNLDTNNFNVRYRHRSQLNLALPFHQDGANWSDVGQTPPMPPTMIIMFVPLVDCDTEHPGIEVIARPMAKALPLAGQPRTQYHLLETAEEELEQFLDDRWYPLMRVGDVCLFTERTLHRSIDDPTMPFVRTSMDFRVFAPSRAPAELTYQPAIRLPDATPTTVSGRTSPEQLLADGNYQEAKDELDLIIDVSPNVSSWRFLRGNALINLGRTEEAIDDYDVGLALQPKDAGLYLQRARARYLVGDYDNALADVDIGIELGGETEYASHIKRDIVNILNNTILTD